MIKPYTIVGVLADQVDSNVGGSIQPLVLLPQQQIPTTSLFYQALLKTVVTFVVKTRCNIPVAQQMRTVFHQLAPGFALDNFQTMQEAVDKNTFSKRLGLYLVGSFAGLAIGIDPIVERLLLDEWQNGARPTKAVIGRGAAGE